MKKVIIISFCFLVLNVISGQTYQTFNSDITGITENTKFKFGPFRLFPSIRLRNIGYDDNVYYSQESDEPTTDYTATLSPELRVFMLFRDYLILSVTENPEYLFYIKQTSERAWNNNFSPQFRLLLLNRFVITGNYTHRNRKIRATSEFGARVRSIDRGYKGSLFYETARSTSIGISFSSSQISFEDIILPEENILLAKALNRTEMQGDIELYYRIFSESMLFLKGSYTEHNFEDKDSHWKDAFAYSFNFGIRFPELGRLTGLFALGYKNLVTKAGGRSGFSGLIGNTQVEYRIKRFRFRFSFGRDSQFSFWRNNFYFLENNIRTGLSFYLSRSLKLNYDLRYGENHYPNPVFITSSDGSLLELDRKDILRTHTFGFVLRVIRNTGIGLNVDWWERSSNLYWAGRDRIFVGATITHDF